MGDRRHHAVQDTSHIHGYHHPHASHRSPLRISPQASHGGRSSRAMPMAIPNSRSEDPPPPLPPPKFIEDLAAGNDIGWRWGNPDGITGRGPRSVNPNSSLRGNQPWGARRESDEAEYRTFPQREDSFQTVRSQRSGEPPEHDHRDEGYHSLSGSSLAYQLHGERPLDSKNRKDSSHAYDLQLLSKIGRPNSPTRTPTTQSSEGSPTSRRPSLQSPKTAQMQSLSLSDRSLSVSAESLPKSPYSSKWATSPQSQTSMLSPGMPSSATSARGFAESQRSPAFDSATATSTGRSVTATTGPPTPTDATPLTWTAGTTATMTGPRIKRSDSSLSLAMGAMSTNPNANPNTNPSTEFGGAGAGHASRAGYDPMQASAPSPSTYPFPPPLPLALPLPLPVADTAGGLRDLNLDERPHSLSQPNHPNHLLHHHHHHHSPLPSPSSAHPHQRLSLVTSQPPASHPHASRRSSHARPGMSGVKRKALSPPRETAHDLHQHSAGAALSSEAADRRGPAQARKRASPAHQQSSAQASYSSASSVGLPNGSYASSAGLSLGAASSLTSISSHDRISPTALPPASEQLDGATSPYLNLEPSLRASSSQPHPNMSSADAQATAAAANNIATDNSAKKSAAAKLQANVHFCDCCPKKPKKFETLEELQQHQAEKQYYCQYCHNRFKNKNEAERHQNSLHLRRHSWSCATLDRNYHAAFHPCTAIPPNTSATQAQQQQQQQNTFPEFDICGYCGQQFPNTPSADWVVRSQHLTNVHKFGECNQSKKFFRADHFRQHLKHSHGGQSGKWTNMLENACMRDEPALTPEAQNQEHIRLAHQHSQHQQQNTSAQIQVAQAAQAAQAAAQAAQAVQHEQQQQQQQQQHHHQQQQQQEGAPALSQYQAAALQGAPVAMMDTSGLRNGPYPAIIPPTNPDMQYQRLGEEDTKQEDM